MLALSNTLTNRPILSLRTGGRIGTAVRPIISPHDLQIIGWWCDNHSEINIQVLLVQDVRESLPRGLIVDDYHALSAQEDLARHKEVLEIDYELMGKLVRSERHKIGKVVDYCYDETYLVQKLYVEQSLLKALAQDQRIIGRKQIIEITDSYIMVKDTDLKSSAKLGKKFAGALLPN